MLFPTCLLLEGLRGASYKTQTLKKKKKIKSTQGAEGDNIKQQFQ